MNERSHSQIEAVWTRQSVWSQVANRLKREVSRARSVALVLAITGAVLSALAIGVAELSSPVGRALAFLAAAAVGLVPILRSRSGPGVVRDWTRARSAAEALKSEVYVHLASRQPDAPGTGLLDRLDEVERSVADLRPHTADIQPAKRPLPPVNDVPSYVANRVDQQIENYYRPQARRLQKRVTDVRRAQFSIGAAGALVAAAAATWDLDALVVWVPVGTTVAVAVSAHAAAARYEYLLVEYERTAAELERLGRDYSLGRISDEEFVNRCEHVISIQNEGWMARLGSVEGSPP